MNDLADLNNGAGLLSQAEAARKSGDAKQAQKLYEQCVRTATDLAIAWRTYAHFLYDQDEFQNAIQAAHQALRDSRHEAWLYCFIGDCYKLAGDYDAAENALRQSLKVAPRQDNVWILLQEIFLIQDRDDEAMECLWKIIEFDPDNKEVLYLLGQQFNRRKKFDLAEQYLRRPVEVDENYAEAYGELGDVLFRRNLAARIHKIGAYTEAQRLLKKSIRLATPMESVWPRMHLGNLLTYIGHFEKAEKQYQKILKI